MMPMPSAATSAILAICVLTVLGAAVVFRIVRHYRRSPLFPLQTFVFDVNRVMSRTLWRAEISGPLPLDADQGAIIICNHRCPIDPAMVALATDRLVHWMVAKEYALHPAIAWFWRGMEAIPVSRAGIDTAATKQAIRLAQAGSLVGMFPEAHINDTKKFLLARISLHRVPLLAPRGRRGIQAPQTLCRRRLQTPIFAAAMKSATGVASYSH